LLGSCRQHTRQKSVASPVQKMLVGPSA
jgi:hypothetical protein